MNKLSYRCSNGLVAFSVCHCPVRWAHHQCRCCPSRQSRHVTCLKQACMCLQGAPGGLLEQAPRLAHNLWFAWHQHVWGAGHLPSAKGGPALGQLSASSAGLGAMVTLIMTGQRTPLAERAGKLLQLRLAARHLSRLANAMALVPQSLGATLMLCITKLMRLFRVRPRGLHRP